METARGIPPRIFIPFECAYEDHSNGFIILIPAGFLGGRIRTPIPARFHEFNRSPRSRTRSNISADRDLAAPTTTTLLFRRRILRSPLINREFNFQPMILSKKNGYRIKRPRLHNLPIYHPGRVLTGRRKRKGGVKTLLATRMGARNPHERAHSLSPLLNRNGANRQYDSGPDGVAVRGGESRWKVLERGSGASFLSRRTIYHPERSIGILNTTR